VEPCAHLSPIDRTERGEITRRKITAIVANLSRKIAEREIATAIRRLNWEPDCAEIVETKNSAGPGNIVLIETETSAGVTELFCGFGRLGASAEFVAMEAVKEARCYIASEAAVAEHLADQLLLPFGLAGGGEFTATRLNRHALTNMDVVSTFLPVRFKTEQEAECTRVRVVAN
jgi:RNA 3'-terminal phosphate cyclase (ATP)